MIAHIAPSTLGVLVTAWDLRPDVVVVVMALGTLYLTGWTRLRRCSRPGAGDGALLLYLAGLVAIVLALLSSIDALASRLFAMHMIPRPAHDGGPAALAAGEPTHGALAELTGGEFAG